MEAPNPALGDQPDLEADALTDDSPVLADLRKQWRAAGTDPERRAGVLEDAMTRLSGPPADCEASPRARLAAALDGPDDAAILAALGVRRAQPLTDIAALLPDRLLAAHGRGGSLVGRGTVAVLAGPGGVGKSALMVSVGCDVAGVGDGIAGNPPLFDGENGPVLLATYEDHPSVTAWRAKALAAARDGGVTEGALSRVHVLPMTGRPLFGPSDDRGGLYNARPGPLAGWRDLWTEARRIEPALIVIDPALAAFVGEPNAAAPVREFLGAVGEAASRIGAGVLIVAHSTKAARGNGKNPADPYDPGQVGGSAAWTDGARAALNMTWQGEPGAPFRCLAVAKANYGPARIWCEAAPIRAGRLHGESTGAIVGFRATEDGWQAGEPSREPDPDAAIPLGRDDLA